MSTNKGAQSVEEWLHAAAPISATVAEIRQMAENGNTAAKVVAKIDSAMRAKRHADRWGEPVPEWARETLSFLDEYQNDETENLDEALAALARAVA